MAQPHQASYSPPPNGHMQQAPVNGQLQQPAAKRPRLSPGLSPGVSSPQPGSPYNVGPYSPSSAASPSAYLPPQAYTNGSNAPNLSLPNSLPATPQAVMSPGIPTPASPALPNPQYTNAMLAPSHGAPVGTMGPPSKPPDRPTKEYEYDVSDALAGTGIDLRAEEQYMADLIAKSFGAPLPEGRTGFPINPPGNRASFYGAGVANQPGQPAHEQGQDAATAEIAEQAWDTAAHALAASRAVELNSPFVEIPSLHRKADKIARDYGLTLIKDMKSNTVTGKVRHPSEFPEPKVTVRTLTQDDGAVVVTSGSIIPHDAVLADQLALLSIATKQRLSEMLEDANKVATMRQQTSHAGMSTDWADAAAPLPTAATSLGLDESFTEGWEAAATSPLANSLKRSFDAANAHIADGKAAQIASTNHLTSSMREVSKADREMEEARLRKRHRRENKEGTSAAPSRAGSVAPGTPGSVAPEPDTKPLSKKELKKQQSKPDAFSHINSNATSNLFLGKKGKKYSWMTGGGGSGASTPSRMATPAATPGAAPAKAPEQVGFTHEGRNRLGIWREDGDKGRNIQLRDWVVVLEAEGVEVKLLQNLYDKLDASQPR